MFKFFKRKVKQFSDKMVSHPDHYSRGGYECKDVQRALANSAVNLPVYAIYWWLNAFKYLWRWDKKNGIQDLKKCKQCIDFIIEEMQ